jgi:L-alanine-DL-glutamate epimerase-like enolase superfamily enzyme
MAFRDRRNVLAGLGAFAAMPLLNKAQAQNRGRVRITEVRQVPLRLIRNVGTYPDFRGLPREVNIGGGAFLEVHTDQGLTGIGPDVDPSLLPLINGVLKGQDPFDINLLAARLFNLPTGNNTVSTPVRFRGSASAEIAVWDLIGKIANQPLYKLWGGGRENIPAYASMLRLSTPEERAQQALAQKAAGWKAIKLRAGFATMREDIRLVELVRKAVGDDFVIMVDGNKAGLTVGGDAGVRWDFPRAMTTARAYQEMGVWLLEEPLQRHDIDHLVELNRGLSMHLAGGEGNRGVHEFRALLERGAFDIVQPEILIDGPIHMHQIATLAGTMNRMCMPHQGDSRFATICILHQVASWPETVAPWFEIFNDQPVGDYVHPFAIFESPPLLQKDGSFAPPPGPGLGVTIREEMIARP